MRYVDAEGVASLGPAAAVEAIRHALRDGLDPARDPARLSVGLTHGQFLLMPSESPAAAGVKVVTVAGSSAAAYLRSHAIGFTEVPTIDDAYPRLDAGEADAIVFDAPVLQNRLKVTGGGNEILVGGIFAHEDYGIALPTGSPLRKTINTTLLDMTADGTYQDLYSRYFEA